MWLTECLSFYWILWRHLLDWIFFLSDDFNCAKLISNCPAHRAWTWVTKLKIWQCFWDGAEWLAVHRCPLCRHFISVPSWMGHPFFLQSTPWLYQILAHAGFISWLASGPSLVYTQLRSHSWRTFPFLLSQGPHSYRHSHSVPADIITSWVVLGWWTCIQNFGFSVIGVAYHLCTSVAHENTDCGSGELNREDEAPGLFLDFLGVETLLSFSFSLFFFLKPCFLLNHYGMPVFLAFNFFLV